MLTREEMSPWSYCHDFHKGVQLD